MPAGDVVLGSKNTGPEPATNPSTASLLSQSTAGGRRGEREEGNH